MQYIVFRQGVSSYVGMYNHELLSDVFEQNILSLTTASWFDLSSPCDGTPALEDHRDLDNRPLNCQFLKNEYIYLSLIFCRYDIYDVEQPQLAAAVTWDQKHCCWRPVLAPEPCFGTSVCKLTYHILSAGNVLGTCDEILMRSVSPVAGRECVEQHCKLETYYVPAWEKLFYTKLSDMYHFNLWIE